MTMIQLRKYLSKLMVCLLISNEYYNDFPCTYLHVRNKKIMGSSMVKFVIKYPSNKKSNQLGRVVDSISVPYFQILKLSDSWLRK